MTDEPTILVTFDGETFDYVTTGNVKVVVIEYDKIVPGVTYPDDVDDLMAQVHDLPETINWRKETLRRLARLKKECERELLREPDHEEMS